MTGRMQIYGRFVGDAYMRPVQFARYIAILVRLQRAAYMPPLRSTRKIVIPQSCGRGLPRPYCAMVCIAL